MGYRSDIGLALTSRADSFFIQACKIVADENEDFGPFNEDAESRTVSNANDEVLYIWESVKAYDLDAIILKFKNLMNAAPLPSDPDMFPAEDHYHLVVLGESSEDIEERGSLEDCFELGYERKIVYNRYNRD
jgi:hypothetical protein